MRESPDWFDRSMIHDKTAGIVDANGRKQAGESQTGSLPGL
jgi:hypothetical protein